LVHKQAGWLVTELDYQLHRVSEVDVPWLLVLMSSLKNQ
jgi:hypothetical protein